MLFIQIKVSPLLFPLSNCPNLQILSNRFTNPFKSENRTFNKFFSDFITYICFTYIMVIHGKRTTIFSIFCVFVPTDQ